MRFSLVALLALASLFPSLVSAQADLPTIPTIDTSSLDASIAASDPFTASVNPQYPTPGSQASISLLSSSLDLNNATLTVTQNGKQTYKGSVTPIFVPVGKGGSVTNVTLTISSAGSVYKKTVVIQPQDVSIIAEPVASMPPLYLGKPLIPLEGNTRVVAIANLKDAGGRTLDPATLSYAWTVDNTQIANSSGIGKSSILVASPLQYRARAVSVSVQDQNGYLVGGGSLNLEPTDPVMRVYEQDPLLGILFDHALSASYAVGSKESSLYAAPYSFPILGKMPTIQWTLNGAAAQVGNSITLRPVGAGQGSAALSVSASAGDTTEDAADLSITFGAKPASNLFGL